MVEFNKKKVVNRIEQLGETQPWNHQYHLGEGVTTIDPGKVANSDGANMRKWQRIASLVGADFFAGKRIVDVGCSDGFFALSAAKTAQYVCGVDLDPLRIERADFVRQIKSIDNCRFENLDFNRVNDKFDIAMVLGILHRVPDPIGLLTSVCAEVDTVVIEYKRHKSRRPTAFFAGGRTKSNEYNGIYFLFSQACLELALDSVGFQVTHQEATRVFTSLKYPRHILVARRRVQ